MEPEIMETGTENIIEGDKKVEVAYGIAAYVDKEGNIGYTFLGQDNASLHEIDGLVKYLERALDKRWQELL